MKDRRLPYSLRDRLKIPLGVLIADNDVTHDAVQAHTISASYVITVGDRTTERLVQFGITPDLQIVDNLERRSSRDPVTLTPDTQEVRCTNRPAEISHSCISKIMDAFGAKSPVRLVVAGEEDLLVIPACVYAPENAVLFYGQPNEGMVAVRIDDEIRHKTQRLLDIMNVGE